MTPQAIARVQDSFREIAFNAGLFADIFYDRLFATAPHLRRLFPDAMGDQKAKLMQMLGFMVNHLDRPDELLPSVRALGRRHAAYGAEPAHYALLTGALLWTVDRTAGDGLDPETRAAWTEALDDMSRAMLEGQAQAA